MHVTFVVVSFHLLLLLESLLFLLFSLFPSLYQPPPPPSLRDRSPSWLSISKFKRCAKKLCLVNFLKCTVRTTKATTLYVMLIYSTFSHFNCALLFAFLLAPFFLITRRSSCTFSHSTFIISEIYMFKNVKSRIAEMRTIYDDKNKQDYKKNIDCSNNAHTHTH